MNVSLLISRNSRLASCFLLTLAIVGCGKATPPPEFAAHLQPLTGKITMNGQPLAGATVAFHPDPKAPGGEMAYGTTEADGSYLVKTIVVGQGPREGIAKGQYLITVNKIAMPDGSPIPKDMTEADAEADGAKQVVPGKYLEIDSTVLKVTISDDVATHDIEL